jgi:hypothetical protein
MRFSFLLERHIFRQFTTPYNLVAQPVGPQLPRHMAAIRREHTSKTSARGLVFDAFLANHLNPIDLATGAVAWPSTLSAEPYLPTSDELSPLVAGYGYIPLEHLVYNSLACL